MMRIIGLLLSFFLFMTSCNSQKNEDQNSVPIPIDTDFA
jgi:YbbR domain-containing protein